MQYKQDFTSAGCCNIALYRSWICKLRERGEEETILKQNVDHGDNIQPN